MDRRVNCVALALVVYAPFFVSSSQHGGCGKRVEEIARFSIGGGQRLTVCPAFIIVVAAPVAFVALRCMATG